MSFIMHSFFRIVFALAAGVIVGLLSVSSFVDAKNLAKQLIDQTVVISGTVANDPKIQEKEVVFVIDHVSYNYSTEEQKSQVYVKMPSASIDFEKFDTVTLSGKAQAGFGSYDLYF
jgi:hypothetical protein